MREGEMKVFIAGVDGYLGWPLALYLAARGHEVAGGDDFSRRRRVEEMGSHSATPIGTMEERLKAFQRKTGRGLEFIEGDMTDFDYVRSFFQSFAPDAIVHLAEMPSAPYSMIDVHHCNATHRNNIIGTLNVLHAMRDVCPQAHLVKLGTMGEYGTPNVDIPEGFFELTYRGRKDRLPFPRQANSWYHQTKVHDSHNILMACRIWDLRSTDIMQGVVYAIRIPEMDGDEALLTRFDFDQCFGTAINRFCVQAVLGVPITLYGKGQQKRGFLPLCDSMRCLALAIENPPVKGQYRVFNQFEEVHSLAGIAQEVKRVAGNRGLPVEVVHVENPRLESEDHYYNPDHDHLRNLGYVPTNDLGGQLELMFDDLLRYRDRIEQRARSIVPDIRWDGSRSPVSS
jgi:UDP-sulfoquinovose synthase